jgi:octopine/nopaline transport system permease protein
MELLAFGKTGWGDELLIATLMTLAVSITAIFIGFFFSVELGPLCMLLLYLVIMNILK